MCVCVYILCVKSKVCQSVCVSGDAAMVVTTETARAAPLFIFGCLTRKWGMNIKGVCGDGAETGVSC